jgi:hypothetical protein
LDQLRRIGHIVRMGRVRRIGPGTMVLADGTLGVDESALYVDCTADGLERRSGTPVFDGKHITLQSVRGCQQVFSAGLIAHVEVGYDDDPTKNALCMPVPHPNTDLHWLDMTLAEQRNEINWIERPELWDWLGTSRLNLMCGLYAPVLGRQRARERLLGIVKSALCKANDKLEALINPPAV